MKTLKETQEKAFILTKNLIMFLDSDFIRSNSYYFDSKTSEDLKMQIVEAMPNIISIRNSLDELFTDNSNSNNFDYINLNLYLEKLNKYFYFF